MQLSDRILVMTYRPGRVKRIVEIDLPRPRTSEIVSSDAFGRYVAQIWSDLREEATRGMLESEATCAERESADRMAARQGTLEHGSRSLFGFAIIVAVDLRGRGLLRVGVLNRFIVPLPSEVLPSFPRIVVEENILGRFR